MKTICFTAVLTTLAIACSNMAFADCNDVLKEGTLSKMSYTNNNYAHTVLAARLSTMTKEQADKEFAGNAMIPIGDIPVGGEFSQKEFSSWQQEIKSSLDVDQILSNDTSILVSSGDKAIVAAWSACMAERGGLGVTFRDLNGSDVILKLLFYSYPGGAASAKIDSAFVVGGEVVNGKKYMEEGTVLTNGIARQVIIKRKSSDALVASFNSDFGSVDAYLPGAMEVPRPKWKAKSKSEPVWAGYIATTKSVPLTSKSYGAGSQFVVKFNPDEEPEDMSDLSSNFSVEGYLQNFDGSKMGKLSDFNFQLKDPSYDQNTHTATLNWTTNWTNGHNDLSEMNMYATLTSKYKVKNN